MRFHYTIRHVPGKSLYTADTLSRAPLQEHSQSHSVSSMETEQFVETIRAVLPASAECLERYAQVQRSDRICSKLIEFCKSGWPTRNQLSRELKDYWRFRGNLTLCNSLLLYQARIVVPTSMRQETLEKIHHGHQGIQRCRLRVSSSVWWPGITSAIEQFVQSCPTCQKLTIPSKEPLLTTPLPSHPWERVAADLFELKGSNYLLVADYYSRFVEVQKLTTTTSCNIVTHLKAIFARFGIPATLVTDNGPQFDSKEMKDFTQAYDFYHVTTSPYYPQANGLAERMVKTVKKLLEYSADAYKALLSYRTTPLPWCGLSPAELLMGRKIRTDVPQVNNSFVPNWRHLENFRTLDKKYKPAQKTNYDQRHRVRTLPILPADQPVWVDTRGQQTSGQVSRTAGTPRSYIVETPSGEFRRNRAHLHVRTNSQPLTEEPREPTPAATTSRPVTRSQTDTAIHPPERLRY